MVVASALIVGSTTVELGIVLDVDTADCVRDGPPEREPFQPISKATARASAPPAASCRLLKGCPG